MSGSLQRLEHEGAAAATTLNGTIGAGDSSFVLASGTGYPTGSPGPFYLVIDPLLPGEEKILCSSRTGATVTVAASGRGVDGTSAATHQSGAVIQHVLTATEIEDFNAHQYDTTRDDHNSGTNSYMRTDGTRHDLSTRHTFGTTLPTPAVASISAVADVAGAGAAAGPSRADHKHGRESFGVSKSSALPPNTTAQDGVEVTPARSDHIHSRAASETFTNLTATGTVAATTNVTGPGAIPTYATAAARDVAIPSPAAGRIVTLATNLATEGLSEYNSANQWRLPWNMPWGFVASVKVSVIQSGIGNSPTDLTNMTVNPTLVANRIYKVTFHCTMLQGGAAGGQGKWTLMVGGVESGNGAYTAAAGGFYLTPLTMPLTGLAAGATIFKMTMQTDSATVSTSVTVADPGMLMVEDIGPNGAPA